VDKRKGAIVDLWDEDGLFIDPEGVHEGPETISAVVTALQRRFPGSVFKGYLSDSGKLWRWTRFLEYGPLGGAAIAKGIDVGRKKDGKLFTLDVFID
jgi:hypothetical protein